MTLAAPLLLLLLAAPPVDTLSAPSPAPSPAGAKGSATATTAADPVARLVAALARLPGNDPIRARLDHRVRYTAGEEDGTPFGAVTATVTAGPEGLRIGWGADLLARAEGEEKGRQSSPDAATPTRDALFDLRTLGVARAVDTVPELLRELGDAKLLDERSDTLDGVPVRVIRLRVNPPIPARDRKYVKDVEATTRIWIGPDGIPLAEERHVLLKGRIFLVIGFEIELRENLRYRRVGDRLVVVRHDSVQRSEGATERRDRQALTTLTPLD